jgi:hypothetical protein
MSATYDVPTNSGGGEVEESTWEHISTSNNEAEHTPGKLLDTVNS